MYLLLHNSVAVNYLNGIRFFFSFNGNDFMLFCSLFFAGCMCAENQPWHTLKNGDKSESYVQNRKLGWLMRMENKLNGPDLKCYQDLTLWKALSAFAWNVKCFLGKPGYNNILSQDLLTVKIKENKKTKASYFAWFATVLITRRAPTKLVFKNVFSQGVVFSSSHHIRQFEIWLICWYRRDCLRSAYLSNPIQNLINRAL